MRSVLRVLVESTHQYPTGQVGYSIPAGCVAPPSNSRAILGRHALPAGRLDARIRHRNCETQYLARHSSSFLLLSGARPSTSSCALTRRAWRPRTCLRAGDASVRAVTRAPGRLQISGGDPGHDEPAPREHQYPERPPEWTPTRPAVAPRARRPLTSPDDVIDRSSSPLPRK